MDTAAEMPNPRGRVLGTGVSLNVKLTCKNWYSNSRTVSDDHAHELWMIARSVPWLDGYAPLWVVDHGGGRETTPGGVGLAVA